MTVSAFDRQLGGFPSFPAAGYVPEFLEALLFQNAAGDAGAISAAAINNRRSAAIEFADAFSQFRHKNVARTRDVSFFPFARAANIDNLDANIAPIGKLAKGTAFSLLGGDGEYAVIDPRGQWFTLEDGVRLEVEEKARACAPVK